MIDLKNPLVETDLHPLQNPAAPGVPSPGAADVTLNLDIEFDAVAKNYTVNNASFVAPSVPVLLQIISGASTAQSLLPPGSVYVLPPNKVIEISMPGGAPGSPVSKINGAHFIHEQLINDEPSLPSILYISTG